MERPGGSLRYAGLDDARWPSVVREDVCDDKAAANDVGAAQRTDDEDNEERRAGPRGDGARSLARLEARMARRAVRTEVRDAMDLLRQQELVENIARRRARTRQRRWFVIGRAIDAAMDDDPALRASLLALLDGLLTRSDERALAGLAPRPARGR